MKKIKIKDNIYHRYLWFITDCEEKEFNEWLEKKYGLEKIEENSNVARLTTVINEKKECHYYIWIEEFNWTIWQQAAVAHEILHFVFKVMEEIGVKYCDESEEAFTYYFENIMIEIWKKLKIQMRKKK